MEFKKKTIIWESNNEPPKNYIWVKEDGKTYEYNHSTKSWEISKTINNGSESSEGGGNRVFNVNNLNELTDPQEGDIAIVKEASQIPNQVIYEWDETLGEPGQYGGGEWVRRDRTVYLYDLPEETVWNYGLEDQLRVCPQYDRIKLFTGWCKWVAIKRWDGWVRVPVLYSQPGFMPESYGQIIFDYIDKRYTITVDSTGMTDMSIIVEKNDIQKRYDNNNYWGQEGDIFFDKIYLPEQIWNDDLSEYVDASWNTTGDYSIPQYDGNMEVYWGEGNLWIYKTVQDTQVPVLFMGSRIDYEEVFPNTEIYLYDNPDFIGDAIYDAIKGETIDLMECNPYHFNINEYLGDATSFRIESSSSMNRVWIPSSNYKEISYEKYSERKYKRQPQVDWNETDTDSTAFIKNKPTVIPGVLVLSDLPTASMTSVSDLENIGLTGTAMTNAAQGKYCLIRIDGGPGVEFVYPLTSVYGSNIHDSNGITLKFDKYTISWIESSSISVVVS